MRFLRLLFVAVLAIILIAVALANRGIVTLSAVPPNFAQHLGGRWSVDLPLFLVIFVAFASGMLAGLVWEWLREAHIRREARQRSRDIARLEGEVGQLRDRHAAPRDEILAIVDQPKSRPASPATGTTLPAPR
ncbi:LapA family protein [Paracoccus marinaquae]|uniref:LapA family protein n=1 Tax=Paracoccus marinaquae TaxID=2841926 RepID=A0ABS6AHS4_9RHOB|nr:LapA family protein [Paracoccus marinaquae]MBU3030152.1 LapA family protein [Paracoccus marinaquae]